MLFVGDRVKTQEDDMGIGTIMMIKLNDKDDVRYGVEWDDPMENLMKWYKDVDLIKED